jgi:hypothetical protein
MRPLLPASALAHPLLRTSLRPSVYHCGVNLSFVHVTIVLSGLRAQKAFRDLAVAYDAACPANVSGSTSSHCFRSARHRKACTSFSKQICYCINIVCRDCCFRALSSLALHGRTSQHRDAQRLRRRSLKSRSDEEQVIWSILKDFCFHYGNGGQPGHVNWALDLPGGKVPRQAESTRAHCYQGGFSQAGKARLAIVPGRQQADAES